MKTKIFISAAIALLLCSESLAQKSSSSSKGGKASSSSKGGKGSSSSSKNTIPPLSISNYCEFPIWRLKNQTDLNVTGIVSGGMNYTDPWFPPTSEALYFANKTY